MSESNNNIRIVMVNTSHPGNIGAVARVMKNMSLSSLYLVEPRHFPSEEANARSSGALDILQNAVVCESLEQAVADCELVIGTSARERSADWPVLNPRQSANKLVETARQSQVALVMGRESSGLTNQELDLCQYLVHIPSNPDYNSLNVAMAVQVFAYEIYLQMQTTSEQNVESDEEVATLTSEQMQNFFVHLEQTLLDIDFLDERRSELLMRRLRQLFYRARPSQDDMNILRGFLSAAQGRKSMRKTTS